MNIMLRNFVYVCRIHKNNVNLSDLHSTEMLCVNYSGFEKKALIRGGIVIKNMLFTWYNTFFSHATHSL